MGQFKEPRTPQISLRRKNKRTVVAHTFTAQRIQKQKELNQKITQKLLYFRVEVTLSTYKKFNNFAKFSKEDLSHQMTSEEEEETQASNSFAKTIMNLQLLLACLQHQTRFNFQIQSAKNAGVSSAEISIKNALKKQLRKTQQLCQILQISLNAKSSV